MNHKLARGKIVGAGSQRKNILVYLGVVITVSLLLIWFVFGVMNNGEDFKEDTIVLTNSSGENFTITVEIAETEEEREQGLMHRESLCENCGMLFVYDKNVHNGFWMKNTYIPLSIAFISEEGEIMEIQHMEPETTDTHRPEEPYRYALEVNEGFFEDNDVGVGDSVSIPDRYG
ncbi:MAG: DUF192 domain-containing protein [Candidatus Thermoplasmatota archaeon]|nr:DUF192 domain-containing protein [Candidatus Thermoplasmatota archaeon]